MIYMFELILTLLYLCPISFSRYRPFVSNFRYSKKKTFTIFICTLFTLCSIGLFSNHFESFTYACRFRFIMYCILILLSFYLIQDHIGKQLFVFGIYANCSYLLTSLTLLCELLVYPNQEATHSIFKCVSFFVALLIFLPSIYIFLHKPLLVLLSSCNNSAWNVLWNILWVISLIQLIVPAFVTLPIWKLKLTQISIAFVRFILSSSSLFINIIILYLIHKINTESSKLHELENSKQQLMIQQYQYQRISEEIETSRRFRHDFKHHAIIISNILNDSILDSDSKVAQLQKYSSQYFQTLPENKDIFYTDHCPLNLLLNYYCQKAKEKDITVTMNVLLSSSLHIEDTELCVLAGNLFINAIEAADEVHGSLRFINFSIIQQKCNLLFSIDNCFNGILKTNSEGYLSTKDTNRGLGLINIKNIAKRYHGYARFEVSHDDPSIFQSRVYLVLPS